ncbi:MAG: SGNH/GDSL hydrolase family protein [bacterium]|nr:SGNH/GDSL hydrolase family protein [bacterium]
MFTLIIFVGFIGLLEVIGSLYYHFGFSEEKRDLLESAIGLKHSDKYHVLRYIPHPYFNYVGNPDYRFPDGTQPHNSRGFRRPEWHAKKEGVIRIVALGGSTTYGMYSKDGKNVWPALLEKQLQSRWGVGVEVLNLGLPAYTTHEIIGITAMLVPTLAPDIVLIHVGANDAFAVNYPDEGGPDNRNFRFSWDYKSIPGFLKFLMRNSRLIRILGFRYVASKGFLPGDMIAAMQYRPPPEKELVKNAADATGKYFRQNISSLTALIKDMGAIPVLLTHPLSPQWEYPRKRFRQTLVEAHRRNNRVIIEMAKLRDVPLVDLYAHMRDVKYFTDAIHESKSGMSLKAQLIAAELDTVIEAIKNGK